MFRVIKKRKRKHENKTLCSAQFYKRPFDVLHFLVFPEAENKPCCKTIGVFKAHPKHVHFEESLKQWLGLGVSINFSFPYPRLLLSYHTLELFKLILVVLKSKNRIVDIT